MQEELISKTHDDQFNQHGRVWISDILFTGLFSKIPSWLWFVLISVAVLAITGGVLAASGVFAPVGVSLFGMSLLLTNILGMSLIGGFLGGLSSLSGLLVAQLDSLRNARKIKLIKAQIDEILTPQLSETVKPTSYLLLNQKITNIYQIIIKHLGYSPQILSKDSSAFQAQPPINSCFQDNDCRNDHEIFCSGFGSKPRNNYSRDYNLIR